MSWLFSQALAAEFSADTCSDGGQSAPSKSNPIPQAYCSPDRMTEFSRLSRYGMTFAPLTADRGEDLLTWFLAASLARTSALPEKEPELSENAAGSGQKWQGSLARFDRASSSWKTAQLSLLGASEQSSVIWPRSGMTAGGQCWELPTLGRRIRGIDCGLWPTPVTAYDGRTQDAWVAAKARAKAKHSAGQYGKGTGAPGMMDLQRAVKMWPTPQASDNRNRGTTQTPAIARRIDAGKQVMLSMCMDGPLNPTWVEWLMGWPLGWSDLKPLETDKFQQWLRQHGGC